MSLIDANLKHPSELNVRFTSALATATFAIITYKTAAVMATTFVTVTVADLVLIIAVGTAAVIRIKAVTTIAVLGRQTSVDELDAKSWVSCLRQQASCAAQ